MGVFSCNWSKMSEQHHLRLLAFLCTTVLSLESRWGSQIPAVPACFTFLNPSPGAFLHLSTSSARCLLRIAVYLTFSIFRPESWAQKCSANRPRTRTLQILLSCSPKPAWRRYLTLQYVHHCTSKSEVSSVSQFPVQVLHLLTPGPPHEEPPGGWPAPETTESMGGKPPEKHRIFNPSLHHSSTTQLHIPTSNNHHIHQELDHGKSCHYFPNQEFALAKIGGCLFQTSHPALNNFVIWHLLPELLISQKLPHLPCICHAQHGGWAQAIGAQRHQGHLQRRDAGDRVGDLGTREDEAAGGQ